VLLVGPTSLSRGEGLLAADVRWWGRIEIVEGEDDGGMREEVRKFNSVTGVTYIESPLPHIDSGRSPGLIE
jgi:hypothetical protein